MNKFTNKNIKKENKSMIKRMIIFILILIVSFGVGAWEQKKIKDINDNITDLNSIIISDQDKTDKKTYVDINMIPYKFAVSNETTKSFYIVADENYLYIAYMAPSDFQKLNNKEIETAPVRIEGITKTTSEEIKKLAVDAYNKGLEKEKQITLGEFNSYFGSVYLDMTTNITTETALMTCAYVVLALVGTLGTLTMIIKIISLKSRISKIGTELIEELDNEMNDENAFYYEKLHLYLTNKYIINFSGKFIASKYSDVIWMYPYEQRTNGIKTCQAIKIMTENGKVHTIATIDAVTKAKKEMYNEIWNTIASKNDKMLLGYTKENRDEIKARKKNKKDLV